MEDSTTKSLPKYFAMVLAFAGDSTMTRERVTGTLVGLLVGDRQPEGGAEPEGKPEGVRLRWKALEADAGRVVKRVSWGEVGRTGPGAGLGARQGWLEKLVKTRVCAWRPGRCEGTRPGGEVFSAESARSGDGAREWARRDA
jgi:hypothetical protein